MSKVLAFALVAFFGFGICGFENNQINDLTNKLTLQGFNNFNIGDSY